MTEWVPWWELFTGRVVGINCAGPYSCTNIFMQGWGFRRGITLIPVYHLYKKQANFRDLSLDKTAQNPDIWGKIILPFIPRFIPVLTMYKFDLSLKPCMYIV